MEFTVGVRIRAALPVTIGQRLQIAARGGWCGGDPGSRIVETSMTVRAESVAAAKLLAIRWMQRRVPGCVIAATVAASA